MSLISRLHKNSYTPLSHLYSSIVFSWPQPASITDLALLVFAMARGETLPTTISPPRVASSLVNLCSASLRRLAIFACIVLTGAFLPARWAMPSADSKPR